MEGQIPQQPTFPQTNLNINSNGMIISFLMSPNASFTQVLDAQAMDQVCAKWLEIRRDQKQALGVIDLVKRSKR
ncbi:MAG TPA: hypothetical protein VHL10_00865 [Nitrososphaera sp.]|jgi:hypothetical protein|nr:hypothetical protein [Nitrososphaera sp.]